MINSKAIITSCVDQKQPRLDDGITNSIQFDKDRNLFYLPTSTSLTLKWKRCYNICQWTLKKLRLDGLFDTEALTSAISKQDLNKLKQHEITNKRMNERYRTIAKVLNCGAQCFVGSTHWYSLVRIRGRRYLY